MTQIRHGALSKQHSATLSLEKLSADRLLRIWREKNAGKLKGLNATKVIRAMRESKLR